MATAPLGDGPASSNGHADAPQRSASPPPRAATERDIPRAVWAVGMLATLAAVLSRAVGPSLLGVWEGADHVIAAVTLAAAGTSQLLAVSCLLLVIGLVLATLMSTRPQYVRALSVGVGMLLLLALGISAVDLPLPSQSRLVVGTAAVFLVLASARLSARIYTLRAPALAVGLVALAGLFRVATVLMATLAIDGSSSTLGWLARALATLHFGLDLCAIGLVLAVLVLHPRGTALRRPRWWALAVVVGLTVLLMVGVWLGSDPERSGVVALLSNIAHHNRILPAPVVPEMARVFVEFLRWVAAAVLLAVVPRSASVAGALALALFSRSTVEVPLSAVAAVIAALALGVHPSPEMPASDGDR